MYALGIRFANEIDGGLLILVSATGGVQAAPGFTTTTQARAAIPLPLISTVPVGSTGAPPLTSCTCSITGVTGSRICTVPPTTGKPPVGRNGSITYTGGAPNWTMRTVPTVSWYPSRWAVIW